MVNVQAPNMQYDMDSTAGLDAMLGGLLAIFAGFLILGLFLAVLSYIFYGIGMSGIVRKEGYSKPWLAWIPIANLFLIPKSVEQSVAGWMKGRFTKIFAATYAFAFVMIFASEFMLSDVMLDENFGTFIFLTLVLYAVALMPSILLAYGFYFLADRYSTKPGLHVVLAVLTSGYSVPFQVFAFRNRESLY